MERDVSAGRSLKRGLGNATNTDPNSHNTQKKNKYPRVPTMNPGSLWGLLGTSSDAAALASSTFKPPTNATLIAIAIKDC